MKKLFTALLFALCTSLAAQSDTTKAEDSDVPPPAPVQKRKPDSTQILTFAEEMPQFPGGQNAFNKYLQENIKYPSAEKKAGKDGTVYVTFVINANGTVDSVRCVRGVEGAPGLCAEAVRVMSEMPAWEPGKMNGKPVRVTMTVPVRFTLESGKKKKK